MKERGAAIVFAVSDATGGTAEAAAARVAVPWLLVHGTADEAVPVEEAERLAALQPRLKFERIEGAGHTFGARHPWAGSTPELDRAMGRSIAWFATHLT